VGDEATALHKEKQMIKAGKDMGNFGLKKLVLRIAIRDFSPTTCLD
jgi:hypothetical protein